MKSKAQGQPANQPSIVRSPGRLFRLEKPQAEIALRVLHTETHNQLMETLNDFKTRLDSKGLPSKRGDDMQAAVQNQIYNKFGLTPTERKALKGLHKRPALDFFTKRQLLAIEETKMAVKEVIDDGKKNNEPRDETNRKIRIALDEAIRHYGKLWGKKA